MTPIFQNLVLLGVPRTAAKVIECLSDGKARTLHEIEREADLRQPEVCLAVNLISAYVVVTEKAREGRGRPQKVVEMLKREYLRYIDDIRLEILEEHDVKINTIDELRNHKY